MIRIEQLNFQSTQVHLAYFDELEEDKLLKSLTLEEFKRYQQFTSTHRKKEFLVTRWLLQQTNSGSTISYSDVGAPIIDYGNISISHTRGVVGIAQNMNFIVGLDLEYPSDRIIKIAHKFISQDEADTFEHTDRITLTKFWCAKETLYKLAGIPGLDFKNQLKVNLVNSESLIGQILHQDKIYTTQLTCTMLDEMILVTNTKALDS